MLITRKYRLISLLLCFSLLLSAFVFSVKPVYAVENEDGEGIQLFSAGDSIVYDSDKVDINMVGADDALATYSKTRLTSTSGQYNQWVELSGNSSAFLWSFDGLGIPLRNGVKYRIAFNVTRIQFISKDGRNVYTLGPNLYVHSSSWVHSDSIMMPELPIAQNGCFTFNFEIQPSQDVVFDDFELLLYTQGVTNDRIVMELSDITVTELSPFGAVEDVIDKQTQQIGGFFSGLFNSISNFFQPIWDWFSNIWESIKAIPNLIIEGIKGLFIPSDGFFSIFFEDVNVWMSDHFGALYYPIELFISLCNRLINLAVPDNPSITLPGLTVFGHTLWEEQLFTIDTEVLGLGTFYQIYLTLVDCIFAIFLVLFAKRKLDEVLKR